MFFGLVAFTLAVPVDYKADEIPVHVVIAESEPAAVAAILKDLPKALPVPEVVQTVVETPAEVAVKEEPKTVEAVTKPAIVKIAEPTEVVEEKPVDAIKQVLADVEPSTVAKIAAVDEQKPVEVAMVRVVAEAQPLTVDTAEEKKTDEEPVMVLVQVPVPASTSAPADKSSEESDDDTDVAATPEKKSETPAQVEKAEEKDLDTQSSVWGGWSAPVAVAAPVWPVASAGYHSGYQSGWAHPSTYSTYSYYPTSHYPHSSYWPSYPAQGWW